MGFGRGREVALHEDVFGFYQGQLFGDDCLSNTCIPCLYV